MAADIHTLLWAAGNLRCFLIARQKPLTAFVVELFDGRNAMLCQRVADPDDGAKFAERLWSLFVESVT